MSCVCVCVCVCVCPLWCWLRLKHVFMPSSSHRNTPPSPWTLPVSACRVAIVTESMTVAPAELQWSGGQIRHTPDEEAEALKMIYSSERFMKQAQIIKTNVCFSRITLMTNHPQWNWQIIHSETVRMKISKQQKHSFDFRKGLFCWEAQDMTNLNYDMKLWHTES